MTPELGVWWGAARVGTLALAGGRLAFRYDAGWLARPDTVALSCALPLQAAAFDDHAARPFFAGLLPEGQLRRLLAQQLQISRENDFALLEALGGECAGAVALLPPDVRPAAAGAGGVRWLDDAELGALLEELPRRPLLAGEADLRLSLAGAQDKLPVVMVAGRIGLPLAGQPSTHILKPPIAAVTDSVGNEAFCLALARGLGLGVVEAGIRPVAGRDVLLVTRYDRHGDAVSTAAGEASAGEAAGATAVAVSARVGTEGAPGIVRLHQEDFCQALAVVPELKYQNEGGPDLAACFALLRRVTRPSAPAVLRLLDYVAFNGLVGNHDAHAKNFSLLYTGSAAGGGDGSVAGGYPVLAPLYDVLATAVYPALTPKMAMKIGSKYRFSEVEARHWDAFAEAAGLGPAAVRRRVLALARALPPAAAALAATPPFAGRPVVATIVALVAQRCALTARGLAPA